MIDSVESKFKETNRAILQIKTKDYQIFQIEFPANETVGFFQLFKTRRLKMKFLSIIIEKTKKKQKNRNFHLLFFFPLHRKKITHLVYYK